MIVRGRLWRVANPHLTLEAREVLVAALMSARRAIRIAKDNNAEVKVARLRVDAIKRALGERGPVWWADGAPDYNRYLVKNTPYAQRYAALQPNHDV